MKNFKKGVSKIAWIIIIGLAVISGIYLYSIRKTQVGLFGNDSTSQIPQNNTQTNQPQFTINKGAYEFSESTTALSGEAPQGWVYEMYIKNDGGVGAITLNVDGFQTMTSIIATGALSSNGLSVVFESYGADNRFTPYKKGDVLFTLSPTKTGLSIVWGKMQPNLDISKANSVFVMKSN